jgi:hypothetical protein
MEQPRNPIPSRSVTATGPATRSLTVVCTSGLCNRLRVLVSGVALAEASGRTFVMVWPRTRHCAAAFGELFAGDWSVTDVDVLDEAWSQYEVLGWPAGSPPVPVEDPRRDVVILTNNWLLRPANAEAPPGLVARYAALLDRIEPLPALAERIESFRARHFRPTMIGVHLRRGDFLRHRPEVSGNTAPAMAALDRFLAGSPSAGILLCTDDGAPDPETGRTRTEGVAERFRARYGDRVVSAVPRSLDRRTTEGVQDALVELELLRATDMFVGTAGSSFSTLAVFGRAVPHLMVEGGLPGYRRIDRALRLTGVKWLVGRLFYAIHGYYWPFPFAWKHLVKGALERMGHPRHWP